MITSQPLSVTYSSSTKIISITGNITYLDFYYAKGKSASNLVVEKGFTTISDAID